MEYIHGVIEQPHYQTKVEFVLRVLRDAILSGELQPGAKLEPNVVAAELGMSPTPVREALRTLQADRLVDHVPHKGTVVAGLSEAAVKGVFLLRKVLEPVAVAEAMQYLDNAQMERLEELHALILAVPEDNFTQFSQANRDWHWALYNLANSPYLANFIQTLWDAFPWRAVASIKGRRQDSLQEHEVIMQALRARDVDAASAAMRQHVLASEDVLSQENDTPKPRQRLVSAGLGLSAEAGHLIC